MAKEIYQISYVKEFLNNVVHPVWIKEGKLLRHRPITYQLVRIKADNNKSYNFIVDFSKALIKHNIEDEVNFKVTSKKFISKEYDFSSEWQAFQTTKETVQSV